MQIDQAHHAIDLLTMLQQKTEGNRTPEETEDIESHAAPAPNGVYRGNAEVRRNANHSDRELADTHGLLLQDFACVQSRILLTFYKISMPGPGI